MSNSFSQTHLLDQWEEGEARDASVEVALSWKLELRIMESPPNRSHRDCLVF